MTAGIFTSMFRNARLQRDAASECNRQEPDPAAQRVQHDRSRAAVTECCGALKGFGYFVLIFSYSLKLFATNTTRRCYYLKLLMLEAHVPL